MKRFRMVPLVARPIRTPSSADLRELCNFGLTVAVMCCQGSSLDRRRWPQARREAGSQELKAYVSSLQRLKPQSCDPSGNGPNGDHGRLLTADTYRRDPDSPRLGGWSKDSSPQTLNNRRGRSALNQPPTKWRGEAFQGYMSVKHRGHCDRALAARRPRNSGARVAQKEKVLCGRRDAQDLLSRVSIITLRIRPTDLCGGWICALR